MQARRALVIARQILEGVGHAHAQRPRAPRSQARQHHARRHGRLGAREDRRLRRREARRRCRGGDGRRQADDAPASCSARRRTWRRSRRSASRSMRAPISTRSATILFEMLTGRVPFDRSRADAADAHAGEGAAAAARHAREGRAVVHAGARDVRRRRAREEPGPPVRVGARRWSRRSITRSCR